MQNDPGLFATIHSLRSMRRLKPDQVPHHLIERILHAGTQAPSGQNSQAWAFVVVTESATKRFFGERYLHWMKKRFGADPGAQLNPQSSRARTVRAAMHLAEHMHEAPVLLMVCGKRDWPFVVAPPARVGKAPPSYGSVYPCVQNILLAARGLGLGASLTTMHQMFEEALTAYLGIPDDYGVVAVIPLGYPLGRFGPVSREPLALKVHYERWGGGSTESDA